MQWVCMPQVGTDGRLGGSDACGDGHVGRDYVIKSLSSRKHPYISGNKISVSENCSDKHGFSLSLQGNKFYTW